jgi:hypothetical protein
MGGQDYFESKGSVMKRLRPLLATALLIVSVTVCAETAGPFTTVSVQFQVAEQLLDREPTPTGAFAARVEEIVEGAVTGHDADLIVFPEYINVFPLASPDIDLMSNAETLEEAIDLLLQRYGARDLRTLLRRRAERRNGKLLEMWTELAIEYEVSIIPGTFFWARGKTDMVNRLFVITKSGTVEYQQDKVYLTPEESRVFRLSPGNVEDASSVTVEGISIGVTICRDTYFDAWEDVLGASDVWIDLRANGERYSQAVRDRFMATLPDRVARTDAAVGVNASLTGSFLQFFWEGPAYVVAGDGARIGESPTVTGASLVVTTYRPETGKVSAYVEPIE